MTVLSSWRLPRILVLWDTRILTDAVVSAASDTADVIPVPRAEVDLEALIRRVQPDAVVVESHDLAEPLAIVEREAPSCLVIEVSFAEHRLRIVRADGDESALSSAFAERLRGALARSASNGTPLTSVDRSHDRKFQRESGMLQLENSGGAESAVNGHLRAAEVDETAPAPDLSIIVPTRNEAGNVAALTERLDEILSERSVEVIFADDSDDETPDAVEQAAAKSRHRIRLLHRPPAERGTGLGGAVVAAMRIARGPWVCVMDGDLQHPPEMVPGMLEKAAAEDADLIVASRYSHSGEAVNALSPLRKVVSKCTGGLARSLFPGRLRGVSDPMSGFFLVRRAAVPVDQLKPRGFKILLEIVVRSKDLRITETMFDFGERHAGESKASVSEGLTFLTQLARLRVSGAPTRFAGFTLIGATGLVVNMLVFWALAVQADMHYLLAALISTQVSTLWNFTLSERYVFRNVQMRRGRASRAALFFLMNNAALLLRGPMLIFLVAVLSFGSVLANLISLLALTLIRFSIADSWIWAAERKPQPLGYDIHGLLSVVSDVRLPELEPFLTESLPETPTINVKIGRLTRRQSELVSALTRLVRHTRYDEGLGPFGFSVDIAANSGTIDVIASPLLRRSPHVLYTNVVEPILRWMFVQSGYSLVHGACIEFGGDAYMVTARTDTGKTTTILKSLENHSSGFLSDDLTLLRPDGSVLTYPKPLTISRHTVKAVRTPLLSVRERLLLFYQSRVHSKSGRQFAFMLTRLNLPVATINAIVQLLVPPPKYDVARLVPGVRKVRESRLAGLVVIERGHDERRVLAEEEALEIVMANCADSYGFPPYDTIEGFLQRMTGVSDLVAEERRIVAAALTGVRTTLVGSSTMEWWRELPHLAGIEPPPPAPEAEPSLIALPAVD
jgi:glycosyltransferase involved in cell wall biosynthesis